MNFNPQYDWMNPKAELFGTIDSNPYGVRLMGGEGSDGFAVGRGEIYPRLWDPREWTGPNLNSCSDAVYGYATDDCGLSVGHYSSVDWSLGSPGQWSNLAPSGQYLASLERSRELLAANPQQEISTLRDVIRDFRASFARAMELAEAEAFPRWDLHKVTPNFSSDASRGHFFYAASPIQASPVRSAPTTVFEPYRQIIETATRLLNGLFLIEEPSTILNVIKAQRKTRAARNLFTVLNLVRRLVHRVDRAFCGVAWSRRFWHLVHGSHPPRPEGLSSCQSFGCV